VAKGIGGYDKMSIVEKRIGYLVGAKLRDKDRMTLALRKQDEIREAHPVPEGWNSVAVVRKWRETR
jgi:hypothetical protein